MLSHVSIGVRDLAAARRFYDSVCAAIGAKCLAHGEGYAGYGTDTPVFWLNETAHPVAPDMRSGLHFCFDAPGREAVDAFHKAALKNGGKDNGKPGLRPDYGAGYYAAFAIDPDGYRIEAYVGE
jgi:catechol 2,3-dioxygenase-like lactoylglutathione lyase family enzyme